jgi:shikimate dehydrogenase
VTARITLCGSLSLHPVGLGAAMHTAAYRALGLPWVYVPFRVTDLEGALRGARALGIRGLGVSMPFKLHVIPLLDALEPLAARIGAVNTIVHDDGVLTGHNTDAAGAVAALREALPELEGRRVLVLGAGGAARAIVHGLRDAGADVELTNRTEERAVELAALTGARHVPWLRAIRDLEHDALVNATSVGMREVDPGCPLPPSSLREGLVVMDIVYKPLETALVRAARERGCAVVRGERMLLHQAARQFALYVGCEAPLAAMEEALFASVAPPPSEGS